MAGLNSKELKQSKHSVISINISASLIFGPM